MNRSQSGIVFRQRLRGATAAALLVLAAFAPAMCGDKGPATPPPKPFGPAPSRELLAWQDVEFYAFCHFGINTFAGEQGSEWSEGKVPATAFNPTQPDCRQWVQALKAAGMKGLVLTARHGDGFCLWPTKTTDYSVRSSPWKGGKGDVVRGCADACREAGLKFSVSLGYVDNHEPTCLAEDANGYGQYYRNQINDLRRTSL
jgi:alpha-L-fucosidase